jgi:hypothetical protein
MPDMDEPYLEMLLREHLTAELNGQLGRPMAAFFAHAVRVERTAVTNQDTAAPLIHLPGGPAGISPKASRPQSSRFGRLNRFNRFDGWFLGLAGAGLAASLAALWAAPAAFRGHAPVLPVRSSQPAPAPLPAELALTNTQTPDGTGTNDSTSLSPQAPVMQWVQSRTLDEGTVVLDDPTHAVPARKLRHQELQHTQWYDPSRRAQVEMTVPREKIKFVEMDTY